VHGLIERLQAVLAGQYHVERELGRGGMATVFYARDLKHDRPVALKVLRPEIAAAIGSERFLREIRLAALLSHPNILPLFDSGSVPPDRLGPPGSPPLLYYVMPYVPGESLRDRLGRERHLPLDVTVQLIREAADALDCAHAASIVHRDIKPENILLSGGHALLADFGIAHAPDTGGRLTETGLTLGTPHYMSPEQSAGDQQVDARSDVYALATVAYEALAGEPPFTGPTAQAIFARRFREAPRPIQDTREMLPPAVDAVIARGLARIPADRYQSAGDFAAALAEAARGAPLPAAAAAATRPGPWLGTLAAMGAVALGLWLWRGRVSVPSVAPAAPSRLAVLPLTAIGPGQEDYFADGLTDELIGALSRVAGLQVIARTSVMGYKGKAVDAGEVGRALGVGHLVEGTVRHDASRARIGLRLVDVASQASLWDSTFDTEVADVFATEAEVARRVAEVLRVKLVAGEGSAGAPRVAVNAEAYDLVLRGRYQRAAGDHAPRLDSALALFTRATEIDPTYAAAFAELADAITAKLFFGGPNPALQEQAWLTLQRAFGLDSTLDLAWITRSNLGYTRESGWRIKESIRDIRHALRLNPNSARAHALLGGLFLHAGLPEEGLVELRTAVSLDPADAFARPRLGRALWYAGKYQEALDEFGKLDQEPWEKAVVLQHLGRPREALDLLDRLAPDSAAWGLEIDVSSTRAMVLASQGRRAEALKFIAMANERVPTTYSHLHHAAYNIASTWALLGEADSALAWLRQTASDGMPNYTLFEGDPNLRGLKGNPAFEQFMLEQRRLHEEFRAVARE